MTTRLTGKVAIVTGGSRGIGQAIALAFAREGARVVLASRKAEGVEAAAAAINLDVPGAAYARACHTGDPSAVADLVAWTWETLGPCQILVNNAATNPYFGPLLGVTASAWDKTFEVNLKGYFEATRQVAQRLMDEKLQGSIINVASILGLRAAPLQGVYGMTKAAVISFTKTLAIELGEVGIRINAIAPGLVDTRLAAAITASPELTRFFTERTGLKRVAQPDEMAGVCVFLASDESSYITGQTICVDAGFTST
jgi:NAD(P)-dependent dehydrogenase (short-subunit alcohol dehydrogenase family)